MSSMHSPALDDGVRIEPAAGRFSIARSNYTDPAIFQAEMARIFSKCWLYVGHISELAAPDQFITRNVGRRSVIFLRDRDGKIRCFLNVCPHRGAQVCRLREGKARNFSCIYHGWTFENTGRAVGVTELETYPKDFNSGGRNDLVPVPRFEEYRGFWFLNFDRHARSSGKCTIRKSQFPISKFEMELYSQTNGSKAIERARLIAVAIRRWSFAEIPEMRLGMIFPRSGMNWRRNSTSFQSI